MNNHFLTYVSAHSVIPIGNLITKKKPKLNPDQYVIFTTSCGHPSYYINNVNIGLLLLLRTIQTIKKNSENINTFYSKIKNELNLIRENYGFTILLPNKEYTNQIISFIPQQGAQGIFSISENQEIKNLVKKMANVNGNISRSSIIKYNTIIRKKFQKEDSILISDIIGNKKGIFVFDICRCIKTLNNYFVGINEFNNGKKKYRVNFTLTKGTNTTEISAEWKIGNNSNSLFQLKFPNNINSNIKTKLQEVWQIAKEQQLYERYFCSCQTNPNINSLINQMNSLNFTKKYNNVNVKITQSENPIT